MHGAVGVGGDIVLVGTGGARGGGCSGLLNESYLAVRALRRDQGNDRSIAQDDILAGVTSLWVAIGHDRSALPLVVGESVAGTAHVPCVAWTNNPAFRLSDKDGTGSSRIALVATVAFLAVLHTGCVVSVLGAQAEADTGLVGGLIDDLLRERARSLIHKTAFVDPVARESSGLRRSWLEDNDINVRVHAVKVGAAADLSRGSRTLHGACAVCCGQRGRVLQLVVTEALGGVLEAGDAVACGHAGCDAGFNGHGGSVGERTVHDASLLVVDPAALVGPSGWEVGRRAAVRR